MHYHFIAIGGSAMHNLAIALHNKGEKITGSDDEIFEPSKSRLDKLGLLPEKEGWYPEKITSDIDAIVLGMHAKKDNPEMLKAQELGIKIFSYPEFLYEQTKNKKRVVIGGSHGKTSTTAMILHVLNDCNIKFDYMVGAQLEGFDTMVGFSDDAKIAIFEGDEYLTSPIDLRPKFHLYMPHIAVLTGIAWDHINVFPTFENYVSQFKQFVDIIEPDGDLIYFEEDENLKDISKGFKYNKSPYSAHSSIVRDGVTYLTCGKDEYSLQIFGKHNLENLTGAKIVCEKLGINKKDFYKSIQGFSGASKRLQLLAKNNKSMVFLDFAHSPSKLKATVDAVKNQYPDKKVIACMELHTYSSLNKTFLKEYRNCMDKADIAIIYYSDHAIKLKRLEKIKKNEVTEAFDKQGLIVINEQGELKKELEIMDFSNTVLLLLSSGNFSGIELKEYAEHLLSKQ